MKQTQCIPTDKGLSDRNEMKGTMLLEISMWKIKQNEETTFFHK
jgi:hypothetical protein